MLALQFNSLKTFLKNPALKSLSLQFFFETESCSLPLHEYGFLLLMLEAKIVRLLTLYLCLAKAKTNTSHQAKQLGQCGGSLHNTTAPSCTHSRDLRTFWPHQGAFREAQQCIDAVVDNAVRAQCAGLTSQPWPAVAWDAFGPLRQN